MAYRGWLNPRRRLNKIGQIPAYDNSEFQKRILWNQQLKAVFQGQVIPAGRKPELIGIFLINFPGTQIRQ
jgi:hypothetical protein